MHQNAMVAATSTHHDQGVHVPASRDPYVRGFEPRELGQLARIACGLHGVSLLSCTAVAYLYLTTSRRRRTRTAKALYIYVYIHTYICVCEYACVCVCVYVYLYTQM
jgi:hypothetical protein